nr:MAG TPA: hypothetical protein [Caudoviricetes sp.]
MGVICKRTLNITFSVNFIGEKFGIIKYLHFLCNVITKQTL